jgi:hypothetical protein
MLRRRVDLPARPFSSELDCFQTVHRDWRFPESFDQPEAPSFRTTRSRYLDGRYLIKNPAWHVEESAWKAMRICGAGTAFHRPVFVKSHAEQEKS